MALKGTEAAARKRLDEMAKSASGGKKAAAEAKFGRGGTGEQDARQRLSQLAEQSVREQAQLSEQNQTMRRQQHAAQTPTVSMRQEAGTGAGMSSRFDADVLARSMGQKQPHEKTASELQREQQAAEWDQYAAQSRSKRIQAIMQKTPQTIETEDGIEEYKPYTYWNDQLTGAEMEASRKASEAAALSDAVWNKTQANLLASSAGKAGQLESLEDDLKGKNDLYRFAYLSSLADRSGWTEEQLRDVADYVTQQVNANRQSERSETAKNVMGKVSGTVSALARAALPNIVGGAGAETTKKISDTVGDLAAGALTVPGNLVGGVMGYADAAAQGVAKKITGSSKPIDWNTGGMALANTTNDVREQLAANVAQRFPQEILGTNVASFLYQTGMSMADSSAILGLSLLGVPAASSLLSGSAAFSAAKEAKERGGTDSQALGYGLAAGIAEGLFETVSLEALTENLVGGLSEAAARATGGRKILKILESAGIQGLTEGSEEVFTTLANTVSDAIIMGDRSDYNTTVRQYMEQGMSEDEARRKAGVEWLTGLLGDALGGFLSGGIMAGAGTAISSAIQSRETTQDILQRVAMESVQEQISAENAQAAQDRNANLPAGTVGANIETQTRTEAAQGGTLQARQEISQRVQEGAAEAQQEATGRLRTEQGNNAEARQASGSIEEFARQTVQEEAEARKQRQIASYPADARADAYYEAGISGLDMGETRSRHAGELTLEQKQAAYSSGRRDAAASMARERQAAKYAKTAGSESGLVYDDFVREAVESGRTVQTEDGVRRTYLTAKDADRINSVAKALGVRARFVDSVRGGTANAQYSGSDVLIEKNNPNPVMFLVGHEMTHRMQELAPEQYRQFRDVIAEEVQGSARVLMEMYQDAGESIGYEAALDEAAANYAGRMIDDGNVLDEFIEKHRNDRTLLQKIRDAIRDLVSKLTGAEKKKAQTAEGKLTAALEAAARQAASLEANKNAAYTDGEGKFSLKSPVEETRDLLALHNKDEKSILAALELGGLPMPSIAVVKAEQGHTKYGPISLVFNKATIDPQADSRNKVYGGDAWTPTAPRVEYPVNSKKAAQFEQELHKLAGDVSVAGGIFGNSAALRSMGIDDTSTRNTAELAEKLAQTDTARAAYLADQGKTLEAVKTDKVWDQRGNDTLQKVIDRLGVNTLAEMVADMDAGENIENALGENADVIRSIIRDYYQEKGEPILSRMAVKKKWTAEEINEKRQTRIGKSMEGVTPFTLEDVVRHAWDMYQDGGATKGEVDRPATSEALRAAVDDHAVEEWIAGKLDGLLGEAGIYNGKEPYTAYGNRRSFSQLHDSYTLGNIVKAMKEGQEERGESTWGATAKTLQSVATPEYRNIQEIKADSRRLGPDEGAEYEAKLQAIDEQIGDIITKVKQGNAAHSDNTFVESDIIGDILMETAKGKKTVDTIMRAFSKEGYKISSKTAQDIQAVYKAAAEMHTGYFEAKPRRAVGFDEVLAAVIPDSSSETLRGALEQAGVRMLEYKAGDEADRLAKVNSVDGARFSLKRVNGKQVVWLEGSPLTAKELSNHAAVAEYITQHIGEVYTIIESGQNVYLGEDLPGEYTHSKYTDSILKRQPALLKAKNKAVSDLGLLIETATNRRWEKTKHPKSKDAKYGMYRYDSTFAFPVKDGDGTVQRVRAYDAELLIRNASDGKKYLYDIVNIKENTADAIDLSKREARLAAYQKAASHDDVSTDSISSGAENVNGEYSLEAGPAQEAGGNARQSLKGSERAEEIARMREAYGTMKPGENPVREVAMPKKTSENQHLSQTVRTVLEAGATPDAVLPTIEEAVADGTFSYTRYTDKAAIEDADAEIRSKGWDSTLSDWIKKADNGIISKKNTAIGWALYNNAVNEGNTDTAMEILRRIVQQQRNAAQAAQGTRILKKMTPEAQLYQIARSVDDFQEELKRRYRKKAPELKIDRQLAEEFLNAKTDKARSEAGKKLFRDIGRQVPSTFLDRWNAWRYLAMLLNPRTHVRNILGNAGFAPVVATKNVVATGIERAVSAVSGGRIERSKAPVLTTKAGRALLREGWNDYKNVADEVSSGKKYSDRAFQNQQIEAGRRIFGNTRLEAWNKTGGRLLEGARKLNSQALELEDVWFSKPHYAFAFAQYCRASGVTAEQLRNGSASVEKLAKAREYAVLEAQKATYHDANALSSALQSIGRYDGENAILRAGSRLFEGALPFRKTPANILARGVEYSPLGLLNGLKKAAVDIRRGKSTAAEAIDQISAGLTGTGLLALGGWLAAQGLVRGLGAGDDDDKEFQKLQGQQDYSMIVGDRSYTLDWLAPEALPFFIGVNLYEQTAGSGEDVTLASWLEAVKNVFEPLLSMTCLQSLNDMFDSVGYATSGGLSGMTNAIASAATSYLTQAFPTLLGQMERTAQPDRMTTYTEKNSFLTGDVQYTLGKASSRLPGWDYNQIPYIDAWGRRETTNSLFTRGVNNFLNPAYASTIESSDMEKELERLYGETSSSAVFPSRAAKYFNVDGERVDLTGKQYVTYATWKGQLSYKLMTELVGTDYYKQADDVDKAELVSKVYEYANAVAKTKVSGYKLDGWVEKAADAEKYGVSVTQYIWFRSIADADGNGSVTQEEAAEAVRALGLTSRTAKAKLWQSCNEKWKNNPF